jgi:hypothetical protein
MQTSDEQTLTEQVMLKVFSDREEVGPVYGVKLIDSLPLNGGTMYQAMPSRADLEQVRKINERVAAGFEVLLGHYRQLATAVKMFSSTEDEIKQEYRPYQQDDGTFLAKD